MEQVAVPTRLARHVLDVLEIGVMIADRSSRLVYVNEAAELLLYDTQGPLCRTSGHLVASSPGKRIAIRDLIVKACDSPDPAARFHYLIAATWPSIADMVLCVTPYRDDEGGEEVTMAMIFVRPIARECNLECEAKRWFGLTDMEAKVASALAAGLSLAEAAAHHKVAVSTARTHLSSVFLKTGTHQQSQVAALLRSAQIPLRARKFMDLGRAVMNPAFSGGPAASVPAA